MFEKKSKVGDEAEQDSHDKNERARKTTVFDSESLEKMKDMASVRMYKIEGCFNTKVFSTCPAYPKFHTAYDQNYTDEPSGA